MSWVKTMQGVKYITNKQGKAVEVILPIKRYEELIEIKKSYQERQRVLDSIKAGALEVIKDRKEDHLTQELADFINEIEDNPH